MQKSGLKSWVYDSYVNKIGLQRALTMKTDDFGAQLYAMRLKIAQEMIEHCDELHESIINRVTGGPVLPPRQVWCVYMNHVYVPSDELWLIICIMWQLWRRVDTYEPKECDSQLYDGQSQQHNSESTQEQSQRAMPSSVRRPTHRQERTADDTRPEQRVEADTTGPAVKRKRQSTSNSARSSTDHGIKGVDLGVYVQVQQQST